MTIVVTLTSCRLFNNPALSDAKIKQVYNDSIRECYAHKAVLHMESEHFLNMFTSNSKVSLELTPHFPAASFHM
jgi:hypothetical protein